MVVVELIGREHGGRARGARESTRAGTASDATLGTVRADTEDADAGACQAWRQSASVLRRGQCTLDAA